MINRVKRVTALSLSVMLMLNMTAIAIPVSAEGESKIYTHDGYTVEYTIKNEWTGNQNIEVKITNTSDEILSDWAVGYNAFGVSVKSTVCGTHRFTVIKEQNTYLKVQTITVRLNPVSQQISAILLRGIALKFLRILLIVPKGLT